VSNLNLSQLAFYSVQSLQVPPEGPLAIPILLDFSVANEYDLNLQNLESRGFISGIQGVFIDNSLNAASFTLQFNGTNQSIKVAPNRQGYFAVLCPNPSSLSFKTTGGVIVNVDLLNFPVVTHDWPTVTGA
jgi:hypothetical protein